MPHRSFRLFAALLLALVAGSAQAHEGSGMAGGFISGFLHPLLGWDHVVAMVAVGLWGAFLGMPAIWALPVVFPVVMALGGALGVAGVPLPAVEIGIAASAIVLGAMVAFAVRAPIALAAVIVGAFAISHGHARTEPDAARGLSGRAGQHCEQARPAHRPRKCLRPDSPRPGPAGSGCLARLQCA